MSDVSSFFPCNIMTMDKTSTRENQHTFNVIQINYFHKIQTFCVEFLRILLRLIKTHVHQIN